MIGMQVDFSNFTASLKSLTDHADKHARLSAWDIGYEIMRLSQIEVPHDKGTLQNSGLVEEVDGNVVVGYHTPYAARLHEHPEYRFQKGRKGKYLEDPILNNQDVLGIRFSKTMSEGF